MQQGAPLCASCLPMTGWAVLSYGENSSFLRSGVGGSGGCALWGCDGRAILSGRQSQRAKWSRIRLMLGRYATLR